jgi:cobalt-zinc-cadmium efflux system membrane fusion protein
MRPSILFVALLMATSCGDKTSQPNGAADEPAAAEGAFCKEHGIAEAICTKCNPKLIPVFQAKGDWCEEHGFPESACPICHPERGGQAAVGVAEDGAPPDGTRVCFKAKDVASKVGIETFKAVERAEGAGLVATATITFDATKRALVNARSPGVIRSLKVDVGATVAKGAQLAIIDSGEVGADRSRQVSARGRVKVAESNYRREVDLQSKGISAQRAVDEARQELDSAKAELAALGASLGVVGRSGGGAGGYTLVAPLAGVVVRRESSIGAMVGVEETLFEIVDTSMMWIDIDVPEDEAATVAVGQQVIVAVDGVRDRVFKGTISYVAPTVDVQTRTARARAALANPEGVLRENSTPSRTRRRCRCRSTPSPRALAPLEIERQITFPSSRHLGLPGLTRSARSRSSASPRSPSSSRTAPTSTSRGRS